MIDVDTAWNQVRQNALKALAANIIWHSLVEISPYRLRSVEVDRLVIIRLNGGNDQELTKSRVERAARDFNESHGVIQRRHLISPTVAEETAFVLFHPNLTWDVNNEFIIEQ